MSSRVEDLEPITREMCLAFLDDVKDSGHNIRVTHTLRTMDEQAHLYAKGRTLGGSIVTNAKPGDSPHNWGCAFDICFAGLEPFSDQHPWQGVGAIGKSCGLVWGGDFKSIVDRPHFERPDWRVVREAA